MRRKFRKSRSTTLYFMKARTSWEAVELFNKSENWHDSLKNSDHLGHALIKVENFINPVSEISSGTSIKKSLEAALNENEKPADSAQPADMSLHQLQYTSSVTKNHACTICSKRFRLKSTLNVHLKTHSGEKAYTCTVCLKSFVQKTDLVRHSRVHTQEKPFQCKTCGKSFSQKVSLQTHTRIHTGVRPFACAECGKTFRDRGSLRSHQFVHSGEKPHGCEECGIGFARRRNLKRHFKSKAHQGEK